MDIGEGDAVGALAAKLFCPAQICERKKATHNWALKEIIRILDISIPALEATEESCFKTNISRARHPLRPGGDQRKKYNVNETRL